MAAGNFEEKLILSSSEETLKAAKQLLKKETLACAYRDDGGVLHAEFRDREGKTQTKVRTGDAPEAECSCTPQEENRKKLCEHAVAAIMYCGRFRTDFTPIDEGVSRYAGLKYENLDKLAEKYHPCAEAFCTISVESEFPHVPTKWSNAVLNVKLKNGSRDYLGSLNNIRQLYFEKHLTITLKLEQFSLHDQQILRFLAVNGEADGSKILLNSEQTAEFFHSLAGYPRFYKDNRALVIHEETAEAVLLKKKTGLKTILTPGLRVGDALLPITYAKIITGRSGCWVGRAGEYFFLPGTMDIAWFRNFFRSGESEFPGKLPDTFTIEGHFPVPVLSATTLQLEKRPMGLLLNGRTAADGVFHLDFRYLYGEGSYAPNSGRLGCDGKHFFLRDEVAERKFESELAMFGFVRERNELLLHAPESIGIFIDQVLPVWLRSRPELALGSSLAMFCRGGAGLPGAQFDCRIAGSTEEGYKIAYDLHADQVRFLFRELVSAARSGHEYYSGSGTLIRLSPAFRDFLLGAETVMRHLDEKQHAFVLPYNAVNYYLHIAADLPGVVPRELRKELFPAADTPSKTATDFEFTGTLREYQQEGASWLRTMTDRNFNVILADEMGLGKTVQLLAFLTSRQKKEMPPALVICPASLVANWEREAKRFVPGFRVAPLSGTGREDVYDNLSDYDLVILSYATARHDSTVLQKIRFSYLILDEAQHIKNPGTVNAQNCKAICASGRIVLTGTPLENSPDDLWSIFDFLHPGMLGSFSAFRKYYAEIGANPKLQDDLAARVAPFIKRRTKQQVGTELPPKQENVLFCEMPPRQRALYEEVRAAGRAQLAKLKKGDRNAGTEIFTTLLRLRQICCHPQLLPGLNDPEMPSAKLELLHELLLENVDSGHKLLLFSQFTSMLNAISPVLDEAKIRYEYLDGGTRNRQARIDHFNSDPSVLVFLLSLKAGGTGLNLTSADTVIIYDPWWNPAVENQAADRTHRIGQTRAVHSIKLLVKDSIEEKILALQAQKQEIFDGVIDNPNAFADKLSLEELRFLLD